MQHHTEEMSPAERDMCHKEGRCFLCREKGHGQQVARSPLELRHVMGPATVPLTKEPLEPVEMAAERIEILVSVEPIHHTGIH